MELTGKSKPAVPQSDVHKIAETVLMQGVFDGHELTGMHFADLVRELYTYHEIIRHQNNQLDNAQDALIHARDRYRQLFELAPTGHIKFDSSWMIQEANVVACSMLGAPRDELIGKSFLPFVDMGTCMLVTEWDAVLQSKRHHSCELRLRPANGGEPFWVCVDSVVLPGEEAGQTDYLATLIDVTRRRLAEEDRKKLEEQIRHVQKLESLGVLTGGIAHDFNNLLAAILGNADLMMMDSSVSEEQRLGLEEIRQAASRASDLTNQMLAYSGKGKFRIESMCLNELVREMAHLLHVSIGKRAELHYDFAEDLPTVRADVTQIRQVVMNLITNASDAIGKCDGRVMIRTYQQFADRALLSDSYLHEELPVGNYVCLEVSDTGCGMDSETMSKLFDPFFTTKVDGRGLGMAAVLGIIRDHHGAIRIQSQPGDGTIFQIFLPTRELLSAEPTP